MRAWFSKDMRVRFWRFPGFEDLGVPTRYYPNIDEIMKLSKPLETKIRFHTNGGRVFRPRNPEAVNFLLRFLNWRMGR